MTGTVQRTGTMDARRTVIGTGIGMGTGAGTETGTEATVGTGTDAPARSAGALLPSALAACCKQAVWLAEVCNGVSTLSMPLTITAEIVAHRRSRTPPVADAEQDKKRARLEKLKAWKQQQQQQAASAQQSAAPTEQPAKAAW